MGLTFARNGINIEGLLRYLPFITRHRGVNMPYKYRRDCPVCHKPNLLFLSNHLRQVHHLYGNERRHWLSMASFSMQTGEVNTKHPLAKAKIHQTLQPCKRKIPDRTKGKPSKPKICSSKRVKEDHGTLVTESLPSFTFRHKFSLLVVGPSQSGKTYFVQQILEQNRITYCEARKARRITWYYNQWQECYDTMKGLFRNEISFHRGLPNFSEDLKEINPSYNNLIILDDLMAEAIGSPIVSRLFTQGRHKNASVILLLQNMFPKGKYNTDISRNAQYIALFRSPSDRKQIGIIAERMFDKHRGRFMEAYYKETQKPYGYLLVDNKPDTPVDKQVIGDIFGHCHVYSSINKANQETTGNAKATPTGMVSQVVKQAPSIIWSDAVITTWQNYTNNVQKLKLLPEGYTITEMYKTSRNPFHPNQPGVSMAGELYWPVKIRNLSNGDFKWINLHENDPTVRAIINEEKSF